MVSSKSTLICICKCRHNIYSDSYINNDFDTLSTLEHIFEFSFLVEAQQEEVNIWESS